MVPNKLLDKYLKGIKDGDKDALANLYNETKSSVYAYALSILKNKALAEEVLQDTFVNIYENANLYNSNNKPLAWILTITKNNALMKLRKEKNNIDIDLFKETISNTKDNIDNKLFLSYLFEHVSDSEREIVLLHAISGFHHREIATFLNLPLGTVLSKYKRTLNKLKSIAKEDTDEKQKN